jgi:hypothetical protein
MPLSPECATDKMLTAFISIATKQCSEQKYTLK